MTYISERIAYVKGLAEGMELSTSSREGKILHELISLLDDMSQEHKQIHLRQTELEEYVETVDEDLNEVELFLFDEDDVYDLDEDDSFLESDEDEDLIFDLDEGYDDDNSGFYSIAK